MWSIDTLHMPAKELQTRREMWMQWNVSVIHERCIIYLGVCEFVQEAALQIDGGQSRVDGIWAGPLPVPFNNVFGVWCIQDAP